MNKVELYRFCEYLKFFKFAKGELLTVKDEPIDYWGMILSGRAWYKPDKSVKSHNLKSL